MLTFDPNDPFPLVPSESHTYPEAQAHSAEVDQWLGFQSERVEESISADKALASTEAVRLKRQQLWIGLPVKTLLTPYTEIRLMLDRLALKGGQTVVDLGAGYGRMAFVIGRHHPEVRFIGYEYVRERVLEGSRVLSAFDYPNVLLQVADLSEPEFTPEAAEHYFLYDFGSRLAIEKTLQDLKGIARSRAITVVGRGRASRDAIEREHPWLSSVVRPEHFDHYSIYRSA